MQDALSAGKAALQKHGHQDLILHASPRKPALQEASSKKIKHLACRKECHRYQENLYRHCENLLCQKHLHQENPAFLSRNIVTSTTCFVERFRKTCFATVIVTKKICFSRSASPGRPVFEMRLRKEESLQKHHHQENLFCKKHRHQENLPCKKHRLQEEVSFDRLQENFTCRKHRHKENLLCKKRRHQENLPCQMHRHTMKLAMRRASSPRKPTLQEEPSQ